ncbi:MAG: tetratricopeptide repeat protein [Planctomycetota bacterium]|nr:tetratricopeptide repeat protein [Planctomycetota bacterium]MDA1212551.1 tetratricopeptide repeat protein [Planctomycetota bacterium]
MSANTANLSGQNSGGNGGGTLVRPWIINSKCDLLLFVGTPLLIIPLLSIARTTYSIEQISLFVVAFGAMGHHLPGMIRAYGDRALFSRFRVRFIVAPIFLLSVAIYFSFHHYSGLLLIALLWAFWHALMQIYGFLRIYDAKTKSPSRLNSWMDFLMCLSWFTTGFVWSPGRMTLILEGFYKSGGPLLEPTAVHILQSTVGIVTGVISLFYVVNLLREMGHGYYPSPVKLFLMGISIAFWFYTMMGVENVILGIAMFEIFHDVQYLSIVWIFNRNRAEKDPAAGRFTRFLFRRSGVMLGLYIGLVFAYGFLGLLPEIVTMQRLNQALAALYVSSGLLHFYYDGFIWKVRESTTRAALNLDDSAARSLRTQHIPGWIVHGSKWMAFVIPVALLGWTESRGAMPRLDQFRNIVAILPNSWSAHHELGLELMRLGDFGAALDHYREAVQLNPGSAVAQSKLGNLYAQRKDDTRAIRHLTEAIRLDPQLVDAHSDLGVIFLSRGEINRAEEEFQAAITLHPENATAHNNLANVLQNQGKIQAAERHFRLAVRLQPGYAVAHNNLGLVLLRQERFGDAIEEFEQAMRYQSRYAEACYNRGVVFFRQGDRAAALASYRQAIEWDPDLVMALNGLAWIIATDTKSIHNSIQEAVAASQHAVELTRSEQPICLTTLATAYAADGQFELATNTAEQALQIARQMQAVELTRQLESHLDLYKRGIRVTEP